MSPFRRFFYGFTFNDCFVVHTNGSVVALCTVQVQVSATCTDKVDVAGLGPGMVLLYSASRGIPETLVSKSRYRFRRRCRFVVWSFAPSVTIILLWL